MLDLLRPDSLWSGAVIIAVISAFFVLAFGLFLKRPLNWMAVVIFPMPLAYTMYWLPAWSGPHGDQHWSWSPIFIGFWSLSGIVASALAALIVRSRKK